MSIRSNGRWRDVELTITDPETTLAEILIAASGEPIPSAALLDGRTVSTYEAIGALALHNGSVVDLDRSPPLEPEVRGVATLTEIAGPRTGHRIELRAGIYDVGARGCQPGTIEDPEFRITVDGRGTFSVSPLGDAEIRVDGEPPNDRQLESAVTISSPSAVFRLAGIGLDTPRVLPVAPNGRVSFMRPPRVAPQPPPPAPAPVAAPPSPREPQPLSWAMILAPIPIGVLMAVFFNPFFLAFTAMTPVMTLGRWYEGRYRNRRQRSKIDADTRRELSEFTARFDDFRRTVAARARERSDLGALEHECRVGAPAMWQRRPHHADFLALTIGYGSAPWVPEIESSAHAPANALVVERSHLIDVPITLQLDRHPGVGLCGPRRHVQSLAAAMISELTVTHGPADVGLVLFTDAQCVERWDWLKWLPHLPDDVGSLRVATSPADAARLIRETLGSTAEGRPSARDPLPTPLPVVIVDSSRLLEEHLVPLAGLANRNLARLIVLCDREDMLPSVCTAVVSIDGGGRLTVTDTTLPSTLPDVVPALAHPERVGAIARSLARFDDPEHERRGVDLPSRVDLRSLLDDAPTPDSVERWWDESAASLTARIGVGEGGPLDIDLVRDGPHGLVAGTTGSGKSELLRTLVASLASRHAPDAVNFVLVDFKGGGAFDACADLPHTVGVVTDLDDRLAARALRCLKAELVHREEHLRRAGVSDVADLPDLSLPRLVLIVDEFATLAAELPAFMTSLVDIAQRGRSLGIHMILATQRPSGVVDAKIRANTNLRLCLRVQSDVDSHDVIGAKLAASIDRRVAGRGYAQLGAGELVGFQTALVSAATPRAVSPRFTTAPFLLDVEREPEADQPVLDGPTDLALLVDAIGTATERRNIGPPRVPWPDPLPTQVEAEALEDPNHAGTWRAPLGLADLPDLQRVEVRSWSAQNGNTLIYGQDSEATSAVMHTLCFGITRSHSPSEAHLYLIDHAPGGGLGPLASLPHVASHVTPADDERLLRVLERIESTIGQRRRLINDHAESRVRPGVELPNPTPLVLLAIAGYQGVLAQADELGRLDLAGRLERIVADGPDVGVIVIASTNHERGIPSRVAAQVDSKLVLRLADPNAYTAFGLRIRDMPQIEGMRAVDIRSGEELQLATYSRIDPMDVAHPLQAAPDPVEVLRTRIPADEIDVDPIVDDRSWALPIGVRHSDLEVARFESRPSTHLVVTGGPGSGKTNALKLLARGFLDARPDGLVSVVTTRPEEWEEWDVALNAIPEPGDIPTLVAIDSVRAVRPELDESLLAHSDLRDTRIVLADRADTLRLPPPWARPIVNARTALLLQPLPDHGDVVRCRLPMRSPVSHPPGRGYLVSAGIPELIQTLLVPESQSAATRVG